MCHAHTERRSAASRSIRRVGCAVVIPRSRVDLVELADDKRRSVGQVGRVIEVGAVHPGAVSAVAVEIVGVAPRAHLTRKGLARRHVVPRKNLHHKHQPLDSLWSS